MIWPILSSKMISSRKEIASENSKNNTNITQAIIIDAPNIFFSKFISWLFASIFEALEKYPNSKNMEINMMIAKDKEYIPKSAAPICFAKSMLDTKPTTMLNICAAKRKAV